MKTVLLTLLLGLVCAGQEEEAEQSVSEVPGMVWSGRRSWVCVCIFSGFVVLIHKQIVSVQRSTGPFTGSIAVLLGVSFLLCINWLVHFSCPCNRERGSAKQLVNLSSCIWQQNLSFLRNLNSFFYSDLIIYIVLQILFCSVTLDNVCWFAQEMENSRGMTLDEIKREGGKFLRWILLLACRKMGNCIYCL